ncbi:insulin-like growth factor-binding protein complex acid labile subunit [Plodia interpunctella]|uniref:insulin-like growth factor-binding protein complex acid labile subunit n=1 Tax=Plodia interpunctella TaxID=58824 RepID=UPI0023684EEE|nr:insulin-like growth factor-binding protein complex acid labile subunit [Plodia interpunctella]
MRAVILTFLFLISNYTSGQDMISETEIERVKLGDICTCSEIHDASGTHFVLNILCSSVDRIEDFQDLDKVEWPPNPHGLKIEANFQAVGITILAKLPPNSQLETLTFNSNAINTYWPDPFSDLPNLRTLSFYQNELSSVSSDLFTKLNMLEDLDLSYNKLSIFSPRDFKTLKRLKRLNLQSNHIQYVPLEAFRPLVALEELDLSRNSLSGEVVLRTLDGEPLKSVKRLLLSANRITTVTKDSFQDDNNIELLDLSYNLIQNIDEDAFLTCANLQELNLGNNNITFVFQLPSLVQIAILKTNTLYHWPQFPASIKLIDLSYNRLSDVYDESRAEFDNLEVLDISGNQITDWTVEKKLSNLINLDLSFNALKEIPKTLNAELLPSLKVLRLDGNPLETIYFKNILALKNLYLNDLEKLKVVDDKAFSNVVGRDETDGHEMMDLSCFSLSLSNCRSLMEIRSRAFDGTSLCMLDLSKNNLTRLPRSLLPWAAVPEGVNLQGNPWACSCDMEWMLDDVLARMYDNNANLLLDLRCASPRALRGLRLAHWYNWTERPLCADEYDVYPRAGPHNTYVMESTSTYTPKVNTLTIILGTCIVTFLVVAVVLIVYLIRTRKRHRARQAAMNRKRQSAIDAKHINGADKEQFSALNKA